MTKKILIINTGGTLSSVKSSKGLVPGMRSDDMLEELIDRFGEPTKAVLSGTGNESGIGNRRFLFSGQCEYRAERLVGPGRDDCQKKL